MFILVLIAAGFVTGFIHLIVIGGFGDLSTISYYLLLHQYVVTFGLLGIIGLITNIIKADENAQSLGWPGGPFQIKYGFSQLGLGIMGVLCIWFKEGFWLGTLINMYIYGVSGLWSHVAEMKRLGKTTKNDIGNIIIDIIYQIILTVLYIYASKIRH